MQSLPNMLAEYSQHASNLLPLKLDIPFKGEEKVLCCRHAKSFFTQDLPGPQELSRGFKITLGSDLARKTLEEQQSQLVIDPYKDATVF